MKICLNISIVIFSIYSMVAQNSLVLNNNVFMVLNGGSDGSEAVLVVNQSNPLGIVTSGTGGNIITQGEFDYVKWNIGTSTGTYTLPFTSDVGNVKIPTSVNITTAGVGNGYLAASTWDVSPASGSFNNLPYPSEVTHMSGANGQANVSEYVVDRFWILDINDPLGTGQTYSTEPVPTISFGYNTAAAEVADGNTIALGNLGAQRYNGSQNKWYGWFSGSPSTPNSIWGNDNGTGTVSGVSTNSSWFRTWTLADKSEPLPVELTYFDAKCLKNGVHLHWQTASELNNDYFQILKSENAVDFQVIGSVSGIGNTNSTTNYEFLDADGSLSMTNYKIAQFDNDGNSKSYDPISIGYCQNDELVNVYVSNYQEITIEISSSIDTEYTVTIFDALGKMVSTQEIITVTSGFNQFSINTNISFGHYFVAIRNNEKSFTEKLVIK